MVASGKTNEEIFEVVAKNGAINLADKLRADAASQAAENNPAPVPETPKQITSLDLMTMKTSDKQSQGVAIMTPAASMRNDGLRGQQSNTGTNKKTEGCVFDSKGQTKKL